MLEEHNVAVGLASIDIGKLPGKCHDDGVHHSDRTYRMLVFSLEAAVVGAIGIAAAWAALSTPPKRAR